MREELPIDNLSNYRTLVTRVDQLCGEITSRFTEHLACRSGCDSCCRHISLFLVEGVALAAALRQLPAAAAGRVRRQAAVATPDGTCPLIDEGRCLLYEARPIICRTHGLPLIASADGERRIDFCPRNFQGVASLPGNAVIDLDRLNTALAAINALFIKECQGLTLPAGERISIAGALLFGS